MLGQVIPGGGGLDGGEAIIREIQDIMELRVGNAKQVELKSTTPLPNISPEPILDQPTAVTVA